MFQLANSTLAGENLKQKSDHFLAKYFIYWKETWIVVFSLKNGITPAATAVVF
jgi:hypothetical protein